MAESGNVNPAGSSAPPVYSNESPPSYDSLFGKVRQMRDESDGQFQFTRSLWSFVFCGVVCHVLTAVIMIGIPLACLVVGTLYLGDCPREKYIPIYLIVAGVFGLIKGIFSIAQIIIKKVSTDEDDEPTSGKVIRFIDIPITCFIFAWFIAGSVWVYRIHQNYSTNPASPDYCNSTLYLFAFWILTVQYILMLVGLVCCIVTSIVACCMACADG